MDTFTELFRAGRLGLTVYSPDCLRSRLAGNLDHEIHAETGFQPVFRRWFRHDINSLTRFYTSEGDDPPPYQDPEQARQRYAKIAVEKLNYGHLVVRLFLSGPSLLTLWRGDNAIETLLDLRGRTHPPEAAPHSIRGRFWCDNGVCNLVHASDNDREMKHELDAIAAPVVWEESAAPQPLAVPAPPPDDYVAHSGISVAVEVARRLLLAAALAPPAPVALPAHGGALETNRILTETLQAIVDRSSASLAGRLAIAFLSGDIIILSDLANRLPATEWEYFVMQCGAITRDAWRNMSPASPA